MVEDFGFYHPVEYVELVAFVLERSNFTAWPRDGGVDNQDMSLISDVITWFKLRDWEQWKLEHPEYDDEPITEDTPGVIQFG